LPGSSFSLASCVQLRQRPARAPRPCGPGRLALPSATPANAVGGHHKSGFPRLRTRAGPPSDDGWLAAGGTRRYAGDLGAGDQLGACRLGRMPQGRGQPLAVNAADRRDRAQVVPVLRDLQQPAAFGVLIPSVRCQVPGRTDSLVGA